MVLDYGNLITLFFRMNAIYSYSKTAIQACILQKHADVTDKQFNCSGNYKKMEIRSETIRYSKARIKRRNHMSRTQGQFGSTQIIKRTPV